MKTTLRFGAALAVISCFVWIVPGQDRKVMSEFRGVRLGFTVEQVKGALGAPATKVDNREDFTFEGDNQLTLHYENGAVKAMQISFIDATKAPDWAQVVGDAAVEEMANGAKAARKVVKNENYWVTMYRRRRLDRSHHDQPLSERSRHCSRFHGRLSNKLPAIHNQRVLARCRRSMSLRFANV